MKRLHLNIALLLIVAALAATSYFTRKRESPGEPLTALASDAVTAISIEHPGEPRIRLEKNQNGWQLREPVQVAADPFEVASITNLASTEAKRKLPLGEVNAAELKLAPPQYTVTLNDQVLGFGDVEPLAFRRYVLQDNSVVLIDDPPATVLDADYSELVAKQLLPNDAELTALELPGLKLTLAADGKTWISTPAIAGVTADSYANLLAAWRRARAMWNARIPADAAPAAAKPQPIRLQLKDGRSIDLLLIAREPQLIIDRPDLQIRYTLSKADAPLLLTLVPPQAPEPKAELLPSLAPKAP